jgi:hypothetical protein
LDGEQAQQLFTINSSILRFVKRNASVGSCEGHSRRGKDPAREGTAIAIYTDGGAAWLRECALDESHAFDQLSGENDAVAISRLYLQARI